MAGSLDKNKYEIDMSPGLTVRELLKELSYLAGPGFADSVYDPAGRRLNEYITIFINSKEIRSLAGLDTRLKAGDVVTILPPMAGGLD
ncbi:hypothetical protein CUJ83_14335 [Methanocella sp. CWC-04]|uniref:Molybdopterin synthase subunit MoaD n=2 Tax=Methanooceanicella nereidis TaxID=2052831 RepID=A0AAP2RH84_9EURY|nr:hypothetical protein [Methanocella sp. CWC-04]